MKRKGIGLFLIIFLVVVGSYNIFAEEEVLNPAEVKATLGLFFDAFDMIWIILAAALVFLMQAGFAMVEAGLTRAKNASNIIMKNLMDFSAGAVMFFLIGWAFMYGKDVLGLFGLDGFALGYGKEALEAYGASNMSIVFRDWMFQVVFAATAATIVSGAMAERTKFSSYLLYSVVISGIIYPISGHWIWGGGWLSKLNFHDFAGSTVVHSVGGWAALMGAIILGPRTGKYVKGNGKVIVKAIQGHNMPLAALGVFILWFGWYGFNAGSTLSGTDTGIAIVAVNTTLSAAAGAIGALLLSWFHFGKPEPSMTLNGALAGLVGITAGCAVNTPIGSLIVGFAAGLIVVISVEVLDKVFHIDDPVGAVSVHGVCGVWGTIAVGLFANTNDLKGLFYGGGLKVLGVQTLGTLAIFAWVTVTAAVLFLILKATAGLRVSEHEELLGLDISEHATESYSGFQVFLNQ